MLRLDDISVSAGTFRLKNINLEVHPQDYFVILGPSGAGKSLLLETIVGIRPPDSGNVHLRGNNVTHEQIHIRNISIVYQDSDLFPHLTVYENIAYPLKSRGRRDIREKVSRAAELTGVADKLDRKPETLSGGEYQRVSIARSIAPDPDIVLLDEPLSSVDTRARKEIEALLRRINRSGITIVHVTHDYEEAIAVAKTIGVMEDGSFIHIDSPEEIFRHPKSEFIAHFVGVKNFLRGTLTTNPGSELKTFRTNDIVISALTDVEDGEAFLTVKPEEIVVSIELQSSSIRNQFKGRITDTIQARLGVELHIDIGVDIVAMVTAESKKSLGFDLGKSVWVNFKASSCKLYKSEGTSR